MTIHIVHTFADIAVSNLLLSLVFSSITLKIVFCLFPTSVPELECHLILFLCMTLGCMMGAVVFFLWQILLGFVILLSAYIATLIFQHSIPEFEDYSTTLLNLFVLLTTANNPNVWANAYTADRRSFFFFFTYLVVGLFFLMNLVFTVIYKNYKVQVCVGTYLLLERYKTRFLNL